MLSYEGEINLLDFGIATLANAIHKQTVERQMGRATFKDIMEYLFSGERKADAEELQGLVAVARMESSSAYRLLIDREDAAASSSKMKNTPSRLARSDRIFCPAKLYQRRC